MASETPQERPDSKLSAAEHWYAYAKDRYNAGCDDLKEARTWARQLVAALLVGFTIEFRLLGDIAGSDEFGDALRFACALLLALAIVMQLFPAWTLARCAYVGVLTKQPERPTHEKIIEVMLSGNAHEMERTIAAYYAKGYDPLHENAEAVHAKIRSSLALLASSGFLLLAVVMLFVIATLKPILLPATRGTMASETTTTATPTPQPTSSSTPVQATPTAENVLATPTPGENATREQRDGLNRMLTGNTRPRS